jgi:hypothetical protein
MATSAYTINKGVQKPIEFKGLKAQYILYAGIILAGELVLFATLYLCGLNSYGCLLIVAGTGGLGITKVYRLSRRYGEFGYLKRRAARRLPRVIRSHSRKIFIGLKKV